MRWKKKIIKWRKLCEKKVLGCNLEGDEVVYNYIISSFSSVKR